MRKKKEKRTNKFTDKKHSVKGLMSCIMDGISVATCIMAFIRAYETKGQVGGYIGLAGASAMLLTFISLILAVQGLKEETTFNRLPGVGLAIAVIMLLIWAGVLLIAEL